MNALDRKAGEIVARYLHEQDPRFVWHVVDRRDLPNGHPLKLDDDEETT